MNKNELRKFYKIVRKNIQNNQETAEIIDKKQEYHTKKIKK